MSREWQLTRLSDYVMPNAVYYQSIWAVRDLERMENRLREIEKADRNKMSMVRDKSTKYQVRGSKVENSAMEAVILKERIDGIQSALQIVPEELRDCVVDNILQNDTVYIYPTKIWKVWKQKFLFQVAKNLSMM